MSTICLVTTLRAPLSEVMMFVNYHLNIGIDKLILFFDDPNDPAIDSLIDYQQVTCIPCDQEHWRKVRNYQLSMMEERQIANANLALEIAKASGYDWITHIDSDELIYSEGEIARVLSEAKGNIVRFELREAVPERDYYKRVFSEVTLFKKPASPLKQRVAKTFGCKRAFFGGLFFRGHVASKSAVSLEADVKSLEIHSGTLADPSIENTNRIKLLHFDCCGMDAWKTKWTRRLDGTATSNSLTVGKHNRYLQFEAFSTAHNEKSGRALLDLYRRLYVVPSSAKHILGLLGMVERIHIDAELFDKPLGLG